MNGDVVAGKGGVQLGHFQQPGEHGFDEERQVSQLVALARLPLGLDSLALAHEIGDVDLGQRPGIRDFRAGAGHMLRNRAPHRRHRPVLIGA